MKRSRQAVAVCGSFAFPARPHWPSCLITSALEVPTRFSPPHATEAARHGSRGLVVSYEDTLSSRGSDLSGFQRRALPEGSARRVRPFRSELLSWGLSKDLPLHRHTHCVSTPGLMHSRGIALDLRHRIAKSCARSVLAVSHDFDGLLHAVRCRSVSPCCRTWGSPRFQCLCVCSSRRHRALHIAVSHECFIPSAALRPPCRDFLASRPGLVSQTRRAHLLRRVATMKPASSTGHALPRRRLGQVRPAIAEAEIRSQHIHLSRWRTTLRSFPLASSILASPRFIAFSSLGSPRAPSSSPRFRGHSELACCEPSTSRPCSTVESVVRPGVAAEPNPILPWAC
jgi:hypothetical protein